MEKIKNKSFIFYTLAIFLILIDIVISHFIEISELTTIILLLIACLMIYILVGISASKPLAIRKFLNLIYIYSLVCI